MSRLNQILILAVALAAILLFFAFGKIRRQKAEIDRLDWNIEAVNTVAMQYKSTAGDYAERVNTLTLEKSELEMFNADLNNKVRELGIKNRELKNATRTETVTRIDTVVKTVVDHTGAKRTAHYNDGWNDIKVVSLPDSTKIEVYCTDSLDVITHVRQKKFLFFRIGKPKPYTTVSNKNPKNTLHIRFSAKFD